MGGGRAGLRGARRSIGNAMGERATHLTPLPACLRGPSLLYAKKSGVLRVVFGLHSAKNTGRIHILTYPMFLACSLCKVSMP